jgi:aspartate-semialdehyde dehydrogenase
MLATLESREFPVETLRVMASSRSAGTRLSFAGEEIVVEDLQEASFEGVDIALFSAGSGVAKEHAPRVVEAGATVIDNSSAFRYDDRYPLVVPEVNPGALADHPGIIANPNCSTIQMVVALKPLHDAAGLERIIVSTYQSASGAGQKGVWELWNAVKARADGEQEPRPSTFPHPLAFDVIPHIDTFQENQYTREEMKMSWETRKIMGLDDVQVSATCVRVPVLRAHSEAVTIDLRQPLSASEARQLLREAPGVKLYDEPEAAKYPLARLAEGTEDTWVGRVRNDHERPRTLHLWVVSDNLLKGAALNAVQIAELLVDD